MHATAEIDHMALTPNRASIGRIAHLVDFQTTANQATNIPNTARHVTFPNWSDLLSIRSKVDDLDTVLSCRKEATRFLVLEVDRF
jgi:hypothetical protein